MAFFTGSKQISEDPRVQISEAVLYFDGSPDQLIALIVQDDKPKLSSKKQFLSINQQMDIFREQVGNLSYDISSQDVDQRSALRGA
jgi:hypothetical protein